MINAMTQRQREVFIDNLHSVVINTADLEWASGLAVGTNPNLISIFSSNTRRQISAMLNHIESDHIPFTPAPAVPHDALVLADALLAWLESADDGVELERIELLARRIVMKAQAENE